MNYWDKKLIRDQIDSKLTKLKDFADYDLSRIGWIKTLREALDMTSTQLARKLDVNQSRIIHMEKSETDGNLKIATMQKVADALNMEFVYGFVPRTSLEDMVREQARKIALERLKRVSHTMALEDQELSETEKEKVLDDMITKILMDRPKDFWNR